MSEADDKRGICQTGSSRRWVHPLQVVTTVPKFELTSMHQCTHTVCCVCYCTTHHGMREMLTNMSCIVKLRLLRRAVMFLLSTSLTQLAGAANQWAHNSA